MATLRILVIDLDPAVLRDICSALKAQRPGWSIHGTADLMQAYSAVDSGKFYDAIVTEYASGDAGRDLLSAISYYCPHSKCIVHSPSLAARCLVAVRRFAHGQLCKPAPIEAVVEAIEEAVPVRCAEAAAMDAISTPTPTYLLKCLAPAGRPGRQRQRLVDAIKTQRLS